MFQLDRGDLDFGLYRIMNMKAGEIEAFLERDLLPQVTEALAGVAAEQRAALQAELDKAVATARGLRIDPEKAPKVIELREQLAEATADADAEADVYGHLFNFFDRYYREGDFMSLRRYSGGGEPTYLIPYDGEEVKLHWANADQYYVKTTENYASYAFTAGEADAEFRVRFEIAAADNEKDNIKEASGKQRRFVLAEDAVMIDDGDLVVRFEHRPLTEREKRGWGSGAKQQERIDADTAGHILDETERLAPERRTALAAPASTNADPDRTLLAKHVERYTAKNSFDYFIHKDLGGFLGSELDLYLKNRCAGPSGHHAGRRRPAAPCARPDARRARDRGQAHRFPRAIGGFPETPLAQEEIRAGNPMVRDAGPGAGGALPGNRRQRGAASGVEWQALFAINEIAGSDGTGLADGFAEASPRYLGESGPAGLLSPGLLKANPYLVLDTRYFDRDFKDRLLVALSDDGSLDEQTDGFLVHSENFQALNLLRARFLEQVRCTYIDPPFNTDASPIMYKNGYKSSTWNSLIENSLRASKLLLEQDGVLVAAIDDEQHKELNYILSSIYDHRLLGTILVRVNPSGRPTQSGYSVAHEYLLYAGRGEHSAIKRMPPTRDQMARFSQRDSKGLFEWRDLRREGSNSDRSARRHLYYPIYIKGKAIRVPAMTWDTGTEGWIVEDPPSCGETITWPDNEGGVQKTWRWKAETVMDSLDQLAVRKDRSGT